MRAQSFPIDQHLTGGLGALSDDELLRRLSDLVGGSRRVESDIVAHIAEVDGRRLYAREACPSMFAYCTEVLHLAEQEAYLRITVARAARAHPILLAMLADGRLHLSAIAKLAPHLTGENRDDLLARAVHRSKRQVEELIAELAPVPDAPALIRKLPERPGQAVVPAEPSGDDAPPVQLCPDRASTALVPLPVRRPIVQLTAPARYKVQFTASAAFRDKLDRLKALMREAVPDGDLAALLEDAVTEKLRRLEARRFARTKTPRKDVATADTSAGGSRYIPAPVRRVVDERDGGQCGYVTQEGRRCSGRERLEFHHGPRAHARGGDRKPENIQLMCRAHNVHLAEREFGAELMARYRRPCVILEARCRNGPNPS